MPPMSPTPKTVQYASPLHWRPDLTSGTPTYQQLTAALRHLIESGEWAAWERLPSEAMIASVTGLSASTVVNAMVELDHSGWSYTIAGKGRFVAFRETGGKR